ncbi:MAG: carboxymuconolactone decarboxylase family protein, partial [Kofleriaceae bacterium]|nr:carboxymuconolactone decarboxylase family protein [Kofleriaceae bacterium]
MQPRMPNPATIITEAMKPTQSMWAAAYAAGIPPAILGLVHLRASQINGCAVCLDGAARGARKAGESDERMFTVSAWRDSPFFTDAERAALALTESITRIADDKDPVPDDVWNEATKHFPERQLAALVIAIATVNVWNRLNV